jgi:hypothetical protein
MDLLLLEPGFTSFYRNAKREKTQDFKRKILDSKSVDKMESKLSEIYSPETLEDNFYFTAKL